MLIIQHKKALIRWAVILLAFIALSDILQVLVQQPSWEEIFTSGNLRVYFLDVGQGDATLIRTPQGKNILIDAGPDLSVVYRLGEVLPFYERIIDLVILTHPDQDHILGLLEIISRYQVKRVITTSVSSDEAVYRLIKQRASQVGINWLTVKAGDSFLLDGVLFKILYPSESLIVAGGDKQDSNIFSLVVRVVFKQVTFLFSGDLPKEGELFLVGQGAILSADVLQAGHHGSKTSTSLQWLRAVEPKYVVISVGADNKFGHPHYRVLKNIGLVEAKILRTDQQGTIELVSDGVNIWQE